MSDAQKIRELAEKGMRQADIARILDVSRQAVSAALKREDPGVRVYQGKDAGRITIRLTAELLTSIEKAQGKDETLSACVVRLIERGLKR